jgi:hypothetical protein
VYLCPLCQVEPGKKVAAVVQVQDVSLRQALQDEQNVIALLARYRTHNTKRTPHKPTRKFSLVSPKLGRLDVCPQPPISILTLLLLSPFPGWTAPS